MSIQSRPIYGSPAPARPAARRRASPWLLAGGLTASALAVMLTLIAAIAYLLTGGAAIPAGVTVGGIAIGGQPVERAQQRLASEDWASHPVTLVDGDRQWTLTLGALGVQVDRAATLDSARRAPAGASLTPWYTIDLVQTQQALIDLSERTNIAPGAGAEPTPGRALDVPALLDRLYRDLHGELADGRLELPMLVVEPPEPEPEQAAYSGATTVHVVERGQELALIARLYGVDMQDIVRLNNLSNPDLLYVGQELTIPAAGIYQPSAAEAPPAPASTGKSIVVDTGKQRIYAYENGQLVRSHLVSTGRAETPTVRGDYRIYVKHVATDMRGPDYYLPQVPYTMYFYQGYGIHGTYWHNSFGRPMSHGCVNLPVGEAEWFFNWAEVGTPVRVI